MKKNILRNLRIDEFSLVDKGAQEPGFKPILKRASAPVAIAKDAMLTTAVDGHTHLLDDCAQGGVTSSTPTSDGNWHSHPYVIADDGTVTIGAVANHTHEVDLSTVEPDDMPGGTEKSASYSNRRRAAMADKGQAMEDGSYPIANKADLKNAIESWGRAGADKRSAVAAHIKSRAKALDATDMLPTEGPLADAMGTAAKRHDPKENDMDTTALRKALAELTSAQLEHYRTLSTTDAQESFLAKTAAEREQIAKSAREADAVVYTAKDGTIVRKSMDPSGLLVKAMKDADDAKEAAAVEKSAREQVELEKRAEQTLKHLPGTARERGALLKAVEQIGDEPLRKKAGEMLAAADGALAKAFGELGHQGGGTVDADDPEATLDRLAKERAAKDTSNLKPTVKYAIAYDANLEDNAEAKAAHAELRKRKRSA